jgi:Uma2 family endonuclease
MEGRKEFGMSFLTNPKASIWPMHRFSVDEYHRMIEAGVLGPNQKFELLDGVVVEKMGQNPSHSSTFRKLLRLLDKTLPEEFVTRPQLPITLATSETEPDIAIVLGPDERYDLRHPMPADVSLIIEVADESLSRDRRDKVPIYAAARIPEYWIVNLVDAVVEVYTDPRGRRAPKYNRLVSFLKSQMVPLSLHGKKIANLSFRDILP